MLRLSRLHRLAWSHKDHLGLDRAHFILDVTAMPGISESESLPVSIKTSQLASSSAQPLAELKYQGVACERINERVTIRCKTLVSTKT